MRVFAIRDDEIDKVNGIGYVLYFERDDSYVIELIETLNEWNAPLLFAGLVKKGIYTIPKNIARLWVEERVIPSGRQNIGIILRNAKLMKYNEAKLLALSKGRSSQDSCYLEEIKKEELPSWVVDRQRNNVFECFPIMDNRVICLMDDDTVMELDLKKCIDEVPKLYTVLGNERLLATLKVDAGGYGFSINDSISIEKRIIKKYGVIIPIYAQAFMDFASHCVVNTTEACSILGCSRQNLAHLIKTDVLHPLKEGWRENVFLKGEITRGE